MKRKSLVSLVCVVLILASGVIAVNALSNGQVLSNVSVRDVDNNYSSIPEFGKKVITIFYNDVEASDLSDPISDAIDAKKFSDTKTIGIGIANLKDSVAPNWIVRKIIKRKIEKYNSTILIDSDLTLAKAWGLGYCNNKSVCIIIGKDSKVKYIKYMDKDHPPTQGDVDYVINLLSELLK